MLIENVDSLKQWLVQKLTPICDAEPVALAKYVCALVRKDKPESELREICCDQLDVFLQQKTKPFVDDLFEGLRSKAYETATPKSSIPVLSTSATPSSTPATTPAPTPIKTEAVVKTEVISPVDVLSQSVSPSSSQSKVSTSDSGTRRSRKGEDVIVSQPWIPPVSIKEEPIDSKDNREIRDLRDSLRENRERDGRDREGRDDRDRREGRDYDRDRDGKDERGRRDGRDLDRDRRDSDRRDSSRDGRDRDRRRRSRSRSISPRRGRDMSSSHSRDERRRRYDDRGERDRRYSPERRYSPDRRYRRRSRSRSPRRYRSPERARPRSRSPRERDLREKLNRRSRSWSRPRSRSSSPMRGRIEPDSRGSTPTQDNGHYPAVVTSASSVPSLVTVIHKPEPPPPGEGPPLVIPGPGGPGGPVGPPTSSAQARIRCQNFDEKGFCMLGDLCPYDHGMDPVVVEDIGIPNVLSFPHPPPGHPLPPRGMPVPPPRPGFLPPGMPLPPPGMPLRPHIAPRLGPPPPQVEPYQPEGYNPEAPAITGPPVRPPFWSGPPPTRMPPNVLFSQAGSRVSPPPPRRDLVAVPTQQDEREGGIAVVVKPEPSPPEGPSRIVVPAKRTHAEMEGGGMGMGGRMVQRSFVNPRHSFAAQAHSIRKPFDFNRLGGFNRQQFRHENTTLEVRKIPPEFNTIAKLNEHFGKFGNLTNIQVKYSGDPGAALISFSRNDEAAKAYHSSEPVFNNRFIKLFWHRPEPAGSAEDSNKTGAMPVSAGIAARLGPAGQPSAEMASDTVVVESSSEADSSTSPDPLSKPPISSRLGAIPPAHKLSLNNLTKQTSQASPTAEKEKSIVYTTSMGNLKKTVFNTAMTKARATVAAVTSPKGVKPADFVTRIEAIKKSEEMKKEAIVKKAELDKQKQILLEKQVAQQKLLLEKLEKGKATMTLEEKTNMIKMLKVVSDSIDKLKFSGSPAGPKKPPPSGSLRLVKTPVSSSPSTQPSATTTRRLSAGSSPALVQQTKKEILDTELELMTKQSSGEDTAPLRQKLMELTQQQQSDPFSFQAASMGLLGRGRGLGRGRRPPWSRGRGRGAGGSMTLDNRPKTLEVRGFELDEVEELKKHFGMFGEIIKTDIKEEVPMALVTFANRKQAELAYSGGGKFNKKNLTLHWHLGVVRMISVESEPATEEPEEDEEEEAEETATGAVEEEEEAQASATTAEAEQEEPLLGATEEEEEEDQESRSWRR